MLYIFDLDDTLIEGYVKKQPYNCVIVLENRKERLAGLMEEGHEIAIVTNQGGIGFGFNTEAEYHLKIAQALDDLGLSHDTSVAVCFSHPQSQNRVYNRPEDYTRRKPSGAMIKEVMRANEYAARRGVLYVGDRPEDSAAADDAGVQFAWTWDFFGDKHE
jgi:D-glycero-D-manno-heptose 1,7-bisphosphate phosphatase